jgi:hypothetical protein
MASIGFMYVLLLLEYKNHHKSTTVLNVKNTYLTPSMPVPPPRTLSEYQKGELLVENYNHSNHNTSGNEVYLNFVPVLEKTLLIYKYPFSFEHCKRRSLY